MERTRAKEIIEQIIEVARVEATNEGLSQEAFALGWLKNCATDFLSQLDESNYWVQLHLKQI